MVPRTEMSEDASKAMFNDKQYEGVPLVGVYNTQTQQIHLAPCITDRVWLQRDEQNNITKGWEIAGETAGPEKGAPLPAEKIQEYDKLFKQGHYPRFLETQGSHKKITPHEGLLEEKMGVERDRDRSHKPFADYRGFTVTPGNPPKFDWKSGSLNSPPGERIRGAEMENHFKDEIRNKIAGIPGQSQGWKTTPEASQTLDANTESATHAQSASEAKDNTAVASSSSIENDNARGFASSAGDSGTPTETTLTESSIPSPESSIPPSPTPLESSAPALDAGTSANAKKPGINLSALDEVLRASPITLEAQPKKKKNFDPDKGTKQAYELNFESARWLLQKAIDQENLKHDPSNHLSLVKNGKSYDIMNNEKEKVCSWEKSKGQESFRTDVGNLPKTLDIAINAYKDSSLTLTIRLKDPALKESVEKTCKEKGVKYTIVMEQDKTQTAEKDKEATSTFKNEANRTPADKTETTPQNESASESYRARPAP